MAPSLFASSFFLACCGSFLDYDAGGDLPLGVYPTPAPKTTAPMTSDAADDTVIEILEDGIRISNFDQLFTIVEDFGQSDTSTSSLASTRAPLLPLPSSIDKEMLTPPSPSSLATTLPPSPQISSSLATMRPSSSPRPSTMNTKTALNTPTPSPSSMTRDSGGIEAPIEGASTSRNGKGDTTTNVLITVPSRGVNGFARSGNLMQISVFRGGLPNGFPNERGRGDEAPNRELSQASPSDVIVSVLPSPAGDTSRTKEGLLPKELASESPQKTEDLRWWQTNIVYQVYPRSFKDSTGSGTGDLKGIASKASYLRDLGVGTVWLSPIFESPMDDFGYDISNFTDIDPIFGSLQDFDLLLTEMHQKGLKVVLDFVPNHSSNQHEWFLRSEKREDPYTDYYVWVDAKGFNETGDPIPPNNWLSVFRGSAWEWSGERQQFYLHQFLVQQPDLNFRNPAVREEMKNVMRFWLDRGVDGFRVDALKFLFEVEDVFQDEPIAEDSGVEDELQYEFLNHTLTVDQPETFDALQEWRELVDQYDDRVLMVEVYADVEEVMKYYGNETHPLADFPFNFRLIDRLQSRDDVTGIGLKAALDDWLDNMPEGKWPNWVIGNHDNGRVASRLGSDLVDAINMMLLLLPGTPVTYYGEEIGMEDTFVSWEETQDTRGLNFGPDRYQEFTRDPERTPMQWTDELNAGFSTANETWLPVNENYTVVNVAAQEAANQSHLLVYQELAELRQEETFRRGNLSFPLVTEDILAFTRSYNDSPSYLVVINTSEGEVAVDLQEGTTLPESATVVVRSITDTSNATAPGSEVQLSSLELVGGGGIVLSLP